VNSILRCVAPNLIPRIAGALMAASCASGVAAPGAHGPDGEHLDSPAATASGMSAPRLEAKSELFELVAELKAGELSILVDRYESNEPVLGAKVEIESGPHKAVAVFHADHGDYSVVDPTLLAALRSPGQHPLVIMVVAGDDADLLEGTLSVAAAANAAVGQGDGHGHERELAVWIGAGVLGLGVVGWVAVASKRRRGDSAREGERA
jgi:hypothetical protein